MKKFFTTTLLALALLCFAQTSAQAQIGLSAHAGYDIDFEELFIGADVIFPIEVGENLILANPSLDFYPFIDNVTVFVVNADALYNLLEVAETYPFLVGAGLGFRRFSYDFADEVNDNPFFDDFVDDSDTDVILNLLAEVQMLREDSNLTPYGRVRLAVGDGTGLALIVGVRLGLGGS